MLVDLGTCMTERKMDAKTNGSTLARCERGGSKGLPREPIPILLLPLLKKAVHLTSVIKVRPRDNEPDGGTTMRSGTE